MTSKQKINRAVKLVSKMVGLSDKERQTLKECIPQAAEGDELALSYIIRFLYDSKNRDIASEIIFIVMRDLPREE